MEFEDFKNEIIELVRDEIETRGIKDIKVEHRTIDSPDGMTERLMVSIADSKMSMAIRLQEVYERVEHGQDIIEAANNIVNMVESELGTLGSREATAKSFISNYEKAKSHTYLRLIPGDSPILKNTPHKIIEDLALVVNIHIPDFCDENGKSVVVVSKPLMNEYGISEEQLFADATANSLENEPLTFRTLVDAVKHMLSEDELNTATEEITMYIASNTSGFHGASVIDYPEFFEKATEVMGGSFYLLPSSVHEFILLKDDGKPNAKDLNKMIKNVNETVLEPRDLLSSQCYHYDAKTKKLEIGVKYDKTKIMKAGTR